MSGVFDNAFPIDPVNADYPPEDNVNTGVSYGNGQYTGNVVLPVNVDVVLGVGYGSNGNEYTGNVRVPLEAQVQSGVLYGPNDTLTGTYETPGGGYPSEANVRLGVVFGGASEFTGSLNLPSINDVRLGVMFDGNAQTGNVRVPPVDKVENGYAYDTNDTLTGTLLVGGGHPNATDVRLGVTYGASNELTGSLDLPNIDKVRAGVEFDNSTKTGNSVIPPEARVLTGTGYGSQGTEFNGQYTDGGGGTVPAATDVRMGVAVGQGETGLLVSPATSDVRLGVEYGSNAEYVGTLQASGGDPGDVEWIG